MFAQGDSSLQIVLSIFIVVLSCCQLLSIKNQNYFPYIGIILLLKVFLFPYAKSPETLPLIICLLNMGFKRIDKSIVILHNYLPRVYIVFVYLFSFYEKTLMESWVSGEALLFTLTGVFSTGLSQLLAETLPSLVLWKGISLGILCFYCFSVFVFFDKTRKYVNLAFIIFHAFIFLILDLKQVSLGMILVHIIIERLALESIQLDTARINSKPDTQ